VGQIESIDRFGKHDNIFSGEVYSSLWHIAWGNFVFSFTPQPKFSSQWTLGGAVYQGIGTSNPLLNRLELSLGYRHMSFSQSEVDLLSPGITVYLPYNLWLTEQVYMVPKSGSRSLSSRLDWEPAKRWHAFISGSFGQSVERPTAAQEVVKVNTLRLAGGLEFPLTQRISAEISYQYEDRAQRYSRDGGAIKLTYSW
jgi:YaiO family outer membrane protein